LALSGVALVTGRNELIRPSSTKSEPACLARLDYYIRRRRGFCGITLNHGTRAKD